MCETDRHPIAHGMSMKQVQDWLGHSTYKLTADTYTHLEYKSKVEVADSIQWIFNSRESQSCPAVAATDERPQVPLFNGAEACVPAM